MCGFLIVYSKNNFADQTEIRNKFQSNVDFLKDRGPDETKILKIDNFLVGFTRLSINSIKNGTQPLFSKCKRYRRNNM